MNIFDSGDMEDDLLKQHYWDSSEDQFPITLDRLRDRISRMGFIRFESFNGIEVGYSMAIIKKESGLYPKLITGKVTIRDADKLTINIGRTPLLRFILGERLLSFKDDSLYDYEFYASSGSFEKWEDILPFLNEG